MRAMLLLTLLFTSLLSLLACAPLPTPGQARATAVAGGCWPHGVPQPPTPVPPASPVVVYPPCPPPPGQPTATVRPSATPTPPPLAPPLPAPALGGPVVVAQTPGKNTGLDLALDGAGRLAVAWVTWGWAGGSTPDGQVFVRVQTGGRWADAQSVSPGGLNGGVGGVGVSWGLSGTLTVAWGDGRGALWATTSADGGRTWDPVAHVGMFGYQVLRLRADPAGTLHLLALTPDPHRLHYAVRPPASPTWQDAPLPFTGDAYGGDLAVLPQPDGTVRRFVAARLAGRIGLVWSADGQVWTPVPVAHGRTMAEPNPAQPTLLAAPRAGGGLVALSWAQYSAGGVFAQISQDGGMTWTPEQVVAQHHAAGACYAGERGRPCGYAPSLAYAAAQDQLAVVWVEVVRQQVPPQRLRLTRYALATQTWGWAITPTAPMGGPALSAWGWTGRVVATPDGATAFLALTDTRNGQDRLVVQALGLRALLDQAAS